MAVAAAVVLGACAAVLTACAGDRDVSSVESPKAPVHNEIPASRAGRTVDAGMTLTARLDQGLDSAGAHAGTPFTATVVAPVLAPDGAVVVPSGAKVYGEVASASIGSTAQAAETAPHLRLRFDAIDTVSGRVPFKAALLEAEHQVVAGRAQPQLYADGFMEPYGTYKYGYEIGQVSQEPGPPMYGFELRRPRVVELPPGARLMLELREPLAAPGASGAPGP